MASVNRVLNGGSISSLFGPNAPLFGSLLSHGEAHSEIRVSGVIWRKRVGLDRPATLEGL